VIHAVRNATSNDVLLLADYNRGNTRKHERRRGRMQQESLWQLQQQLQSANAQTRRHAAEKLGQLKDGRAVEALLVALTKGERDRLVQEAVAKALVEIRDPRAVPALIDALQHHQDEFVRVFAVWILGKLAGAQVIDVLVKALQEGRGVDGMGVRQTAAGALGEIGDPRAVEPLIAALMRADKWEVHWSIVEALGKIGGPQAIEALERVLNDNHMDVGVREEASRALEEAQRRIWAVAPFAWLSIETGKSLGQIYELHQEVVRIGRIPSSDLFLGDPTVGRVHAEIVRLEEGAYGVRDTGSANGVVLNGQRLQGSAIRPLQNGDQICLGEVVLVFHQRTE
jgi:HEAT repeat protein